MPTAPNTVLIHAGPVFSYKHTNTTLMLTLTPANWCDSMTKLCVHNCVFRMCMKSDSQSILQIIACF